MKGFRALYWKYLYLLGKVKKQQAPRFISIELKTELIKLEQYSKQLQMLNRYGVETHEQFDALEHQLSQDIASLVEQRVAAPDGEGKKLLTAELRRLRMDLRLVGDVRADALEIEWRAQRLDLVHDIILDRQRQREQPPQQQFR